MHKNNARAEPPDRMSADLADEIGGLLIAYLRGEAPRTSNLLGFDNYLQPEAEDFEGNKRTFSFTNLDEFYNFIDDFKEFIRNDVSIREFVTRKSYTDQERSRRLRESVALTASDRFLRFLEKKGLPEEEAQRFGKLHQEFLQDNLPEVEVLSAVQELRDQFHSGPPVEQKRPYPGKRSKTEDSDPLKFLEDVYGDDIRAARLTTGRLQEIDPLLYQALYHELRVQGFTVADVVEPKGKAYARRVEAFAVLLGISSVEDAGRFFGMRPDRIAKHIKSAER